MIEQPNKIIRDFIKTLDKQCKMTISSSYIIHEYLEAPHEPNNLPIGKGAVYVFTLPPTSNTIAGPNRALKVGKTGKNSNARFKYQHYKSGSANSTLAGAIENNLILLSYIGIKKLPDDIGYWIKKNTDRDNFFLEGDNKHVLSLFEVFLKGRLGPVYEGSLSKGG